MISDHLPGIGRRCDEEDEHGDAAERLRALERLRAELETAEQLLDDTEEELRERRHGRPSPPDGS